MLVININSFAQEAKELVFNVQKTSYKDLIIVENDTLLFNQPNLFKIKNKTLLNKYKLVLDGGELEIKGEYLILNPIVDNEVYLRVIDKSKGEDSVPVGVLRFYVYKKYKFSIFQGNYPWGENPEDPYDLSERLTNDEFSIRIIKGHQKTIYKVVSFYISIEIDGNYQEFYIKGNTVPSDTSNYVDNSVFRYMKIDRFVAVKSKENNNGVIRTFDDEAEMEFNIEPLEEIIMNPYEYK